MMYGAHPAGYGGGLGASLGAINWDRVREALENVGRGVYSAAKERAMRELLEAVQGTAKFREIEREVARARSAQLMEKYGPLLILGGVAFLLMRSR